ncbi:MAG: HAD family hydrolase [Myxococcota bacterium]|nr:HAD family hydrolase [Myxococcota bacterium]
MSRLPLGEIETLFLDAGNTLVSVDFEWIAREIRERGHACEAESLLRAEALARPHLDAWLSGERSTEGGSSFVRFLTLALGHVSSLDGVDHRELALDLAPVLAIPGASDRLWCRVMPEVPEALARFEALGLKLVVVSNADGTVERSLTNLGLRDPFELVIDSHVVGAEKPSPEIFEIALERSRARRESTLHVGDLIFADVEGARGAGLHAALLDPFGDREEPDCPVFADLAALATALENAR